MVTTEEMISNEIMKPSSPTPILFKTHHLSFLDQIGPPVYFSLIFFYQHNPNFNHAKISQSLKQSLSQILSHYYPLAGTLHQNWFIDCDDSGVEFIEARVHSPLSHFIENPKREELRQLIVNSTHSNSALVALKLSFFECGGFSLGVCCSHKIGDCASFVGFIKAWADACCSKTLIPPPSFDVSLRFPPRALAPDYSNKRRENKVTKRLVFDKEMLEKIRARSVCDEVKNPTRVEALSSFIWKMFIDATKMNRGPEKSSFAASHFVNLRPRSVPPIPDQTFGNCSIGQFAFTSKDEMSDLVTSLRVALRSVDDDYIKNVVSSEEYLSVLDEANKPCKNGATGLCYFSSWWRFPMYDVDFGFGKPNWVCTVNQSNNNLVLLMGTPQGDGIEAWINMPLDFSQVFETTYNELVTSI